MLRASEHRRAIEIIMSRPDYKNAVDCARKNSKDGGKFYAVGGTIYRALAEAVHGRSAGLTESTDLDFVLLEPGERIAPPMQHWWQLVYPVSQSSSFGSANRQSRAYHTQKVKYDMVAIDDVWKRLDANRHASLIGQRIINAYFAVVPLSIQAIALDVDRREIFGPAAIQDILNGVVTWNNKEALGPKHTPNEYIAAKASSMGFAHSLADRKPMWPCNCFGDDTQALWANGCQDKENHY